MATESSVNENYKAIEWAGSIPLDWEIKKARWLFKERNEKGNPVSVQLLTPSQKYGVLPQHLYQTISGAKPVQIGEEKDLSEFKTVRKGDFCISLSAYMGGFEYSEFDGVISPAYHSFYKTSDSIDNMYFKYLFKTQAFIDVINLITPQSVRVGRNTSFESFKDVKLPVPPLKEQRIIAAKLNELCSQIDEIVFIATSSIEEYKALQQTVILEAVTQGIDGSRQMKESGIFWAMNIPANWDVGKVSRYFSVELGKMLDEKRISGKRLKPYLRNADVQWYGINTNNLNEMDFSEEEDARYSVKSGDLLVCEGGDVGKSCIVPDGFPEGIYYQKALHRVRAYDGDLFSLKWLRYILFVMSKYGFFNTFSGDKATIQHLPAVTFNQLKFPLPKQKEKERIIQYLEKRIPEFDALISEKQALIQDLQAYKKSLIYEMVTGKRKVV